MKKNILLSFVFITLILSLHILITLHTANTHAAFTSNLDKDDCFVCSTSGNHSKLFNSKLDNLGLVNLNTFEVLPIEINLFNNYDEYLEETAGIMTARQLIGSDTYAHAFIFHDNGYAHVEIFGIQYKIDRNAVQNHLCQSCLDSINTLYLIETPPVEYAVISFADQTIHMLSEGCPSFSVGNYTSECTFHDNGRIDLLIHYHVP